MTLLTLIRLYKGSAPKIFTYSFCLHDSYLIALETVHLAELFEFTQESVLCWRLDVEKISEPGNVAS